MTNIQSYYNYICSFKRDNDVSVDTCHSMLIFGLLTSYKPARVLELGIGNGYITKCILYALRYNLFGRLDTVDSFHDWSNHNDPKLISMIKELERLCAIIHAPITEHDFVYSVPKDTYDFVMSDADHHHAGEWTDQVFHITKPGGIIVVHDIHAYKSPFNYVLEARRLNKPVIVLDKSSREDESCKNGLAIIHNIK